MTAASYASCYHEGLRNSLDDLCKKCTFKSNSASLLCRKSKTDCTLYNCVIAEFVLSTYHESVIKDEIPIGAIARAIHSHGYTGELRQSKVVKI